MSDIQNRLKTKTAAIRQQRIAATRLQSALADPTNDLLHAVSKLTWVCRQNLPKYIIAEVAEAIALIKPHAVDPKDSNR